MISRIRHFVNRETTVIVVPIRAKRIIIEYLTLGQWCTWWDMRSITSSEPSESGSIFNRSIAKETMNWRKGTLKLPLRAQEGYWEPVNHLSHDRRPRHAHILSSKKVFLSTWVIYHRRAYRCRVSLRGIIIEKTKQFQRIVTYVTPGNLCGKNFSEELKSANSQPQLRIKQKQGLGGHKDESDTVPNMPEKVKPRSIILYRNNRSISKR